MYQPGARAPNLVGGGYQSDSLEGDLYALAAYRLPHSRLEPFGYVEGYRVPTADGNLQATGSIGLNLYFTPAIQLKVQYSHSRWYTTAGTDISKEPTIENFLAAKLVMGL